MNYKGYTFKIFEEDNEWFWSFRDEYEMAGTHWPHGDHRRDGKAEKTNAIRSAKGFVNKLIRKGY